MIGDGGNDDHQSSCDNDGGLPKVYGTTAKLLWLARLMIVIGDNDGGDDGDDGDDGGG